MTLLPCFWFFETPDARGQVFSTSGCRYIRIFNTEAGFCGGLRPVLRQYAAALGPPAGKRGQLQGVHFAEMRSRKADLATCSAAIAAFGWRICGEVEAKTAKRDETIAALRVKFAK